MKTRFPNQVFSPLAADAGNVSPKNTEELIAELQSLVGDSREQSAEILAAMGRLWNCADLHQVASQLVHFRGNTRAQQILESARWVFRDQNVADWPNRGRQRPLLAIEQALNTPTKYDQRRC